MSDAGPLDDLVLDFDPDALREKYKQERDKRVRADGNSQYVEVEGRFAHFVEDHYVEPGFTRAPPRPITSPSPSSAAASPGW